MNKRVVIDRRSHLSGNAYSGPSLGPASRSTSLYEHLFHNPTSVWDYVRQFWNSPDTSAGIYPLQRAGPTRSRWDSGLVAQFFGRYYGPDGARALIAEQPPRSTPPMHRTSREGDLVGSAAATRRSSRASPPNSGRPIPKSFPASTINRLPVRYVRQSVLQRHLRGLPVDGPTAWLTNMAADSRIDVRLDTDWFVRDELRAASPGRSGRFTPTAGPFDYAEGRLGWRIGLRTRGTTGDFQGTLVMKLQRRGTYPASTNSRHSTPNGTIARPTRRSSCGVLPIRHQTTNRTTRSTPSRPRPTGPPTERSQKRTATAKVLFGGRSAPTKYLDMHMVTS